VDAAVPTVEVADDTHPVGVGSPDGKVNAARGAEIDDVRTELLVRPVLRALAEEVEVEIAENAAVTVRVVDDAPAAVRGLDLEAVVAVGRLALEVEERLEDAVGWMRLIGTAGSWPRGSTAMSSASGSNDRTKVPRTPPRSPLWGPRRAKGSRLVPARSFSIGSSAGGEGGSG